MTVIDSSVTTPDSPLRRALRADGVCSAAAGAVILAAAGPLATWTGIPRSVEYAVGVGFLIYGATLLVLARRTRVRGAGLGVAAANAAGTVIALIALVLAVPPLTAAGAAGVAGLGMYTAAFAVVQYLGARRLT